MPPGIRVAALTSGPHVPSARFRVRQHLPLLSESGIKVREYCPSLGGRPLRPAFLAQARGRYVLPFFAVETLILLAQRLPGVIGSYRADITWLERSFVPMLDDAACMLNRPLVVDVDDAIWLYNPFGRRTFSRLIGRAAAVMAGNHYLADFCSDYCDVVRVVPTAVDAARFTPRPESGLSRDRFVIGWTGSATNFRYLYAIEDALRRILQAIPRSQLLIVAERPPRFRSIASERIRFDPWTAETEHRLVQEMDVGLMPLEDSEIARGKCSFKMLQYMSCGIPAVASPVGMNAELLGSAEVGIGARSVDDWVDAVTAYWREPELRATHGRAGRERVLDGYDLPVIARRIAQTFASIR